MKVMQSILFVLIGVMIGVAVNSLDTVKLISSAREFAVENGKVLLVAVAVLVGMKIVSSPTRSF